MTVDTVFPSHSRIGESATIVRVIKRTFNRRAKKISGGCCSVWRVQRPFLHTTMCPTALHFKVEIRGLSQFVAELTFQLYGGVQQTLNWGKQRKITTLPLRAAYISIPQPRRRPILVSQPPIGNGLVKSLKNVCFLRHAMLFKSYQFRMKTFISLPQIYFRVDKGHILGIVNTTVSITWQDFEGGKLRNFVSTG